MRTVTECHTAMDLCKTHNVIRLRNSYINEEAAYKTISCAIMETLKNLGKFLCNLKCKWETQAEKKETMWGLEEVRKEVW